MEKTIAGPTRQTQHGLLFALSELVQVLWAWVTGEGDLFALLVAWGEVVAGYVATE